MDGFTGCILSCAPALGCQVGDSWGDLNQLNRQYRGSAAEFAVRRRPRAVRSSAGATTRASGPSRSSSRSSHARSLTASTISSEPSARSVTDFRRIRLGDPRGRGRELERDARCRSAGACTRRRSRSRSRPARTSRRSADRRMRSTRNMRSSSRAVAIRADVPLAGREEHDLGIDPARRELVAPGRPVVDLDARRGARPRRGSPRVGPGSPTSTTRSGSSSASCELGERGRERSVRIGAGNREQRAPGGEQRETFGGREPQRRAGSSRRDGS